MSTPPPKLLAGTALIFWGVLTGNTTVGLLAAVLLEARSWLPLRWDFKRESYVRAWQISILCGALIALLAWMNGMKAGKIHTLFVWAPLIMLPLELAQRYGTAKKIPLNTFAIFSRKDPAHHPGGHTTPPRTLNTGYPYIATVILATAMASRNELHHFAALAIITTSCLYAHMRHRGFRPWAWATALLLVITLSWFGQWGMFKLYNYLTGTSGSGSGRHTAANESVTSIGRLGRLKLSPKIFWRMHVNHGNTPHLLRTATYNQYSRARWSHEFNKSPNSRFDDAGYRTFSRDDTAPEGSRDIRWFTTSPPLLTQTAPITLTGEIDTKVTENPLPLPHFFLAVADLDAGADIECNALGTVRMANPDYNVIQYAVWQGDTSSTEDPPDTEPDKKNNLDLSVPPPERKALQRICTQLGLDDPTLSTRAKIRKLRHFFNTKFQYTTHLRTPPTDHKHRSTAVGHFLEHTRAGHCEYFATATALLLRTANIPTRYCVGFSVSEHDRDRDEWIMRGQHAHAWCRVWIEEPNHPSGKTTGHWEDLDLTPAAWETADIADNSHWQQRLTDRWQRFREDFLIWRTREANKTKVYTATAAILTLLTLWITLRLWHSRQRRTHHRPKNTPVTPLHKLEKLAAKKIGPRPAGTPLCTWLHRLLLLTDDPHTHHLLHTATTLHSQIRFDPHPTPTQQQTHLKTLCTTLKPIIKNLPNARPSSPFFRPNLSTETTTTRFHRTH